MRSTEPPFGTRLWVALVALALVLSALAPAAAIPQPDGTIGLEQTADQGTVAPGGTVALEATVNATGYNAPAMSLSLPAGWTVQSQSADGPATYKSSTNEWVWLSGGEYTVTYTVAVPGDAAEGDYTIANDGSAVDPADGSFVDNQASTTVAVQAAPANQPPTADAGADGTVQAGDQVTLDASGSSDADGSVESFAWTQTGGPMVSLSDDAAAQPTFAAPDVGSETTLTFQVAVTDDDGATATDEVAVTVQPTQAPPAGDVSVTQTAPSPVAPGDAPTVEVTVDATGLNAPALQLSLPAGWTVQSQSADGPATYKSSTNEWVWLSGGEYTVTYTVAVPGDAAEGDYVLGADASAIDPDQGDQQVTDSTQSTVAVADEPDQPPGDAPTTAVALAPSSDLLGVGGTTTFDVVVETADGGVGAYDLAVSVEDTSVATITDASAVAVTDQQFSDVSVAGDGSAAIVEAAIADTADSGAATVATVTVEAQADGTTGLSLAVDALGDESGTSYAVTATDGATLEVSNLLVGDSDAPAQDLDGDGTYEDVNGDGTVDMADVQLLWTARAGPTVSANPDAFDFNGDGTFDVADVQALYSGEVSG